LDELLSFLLCISVFYRTKARFIAMPMALSGMFEFRMAYGVANGPENGLISVPASLNLGGK